MARTPFLSVLFSHIFAHFTGPITYQRVNIITIGLQGAFWRSGMARLSVTASALVVRWYHFNLCVLTEWCVLDWHSQAFRAAEAEMGNPTANNPAARRRFKAAGNLVRAGVRIKDRAALAGFGNNFVSGQRAGRVGHRSAPTPQPRTRNAPANRFKAAGNVRRLH